jgi:hypothetical protein
MRGTEGRSVACGRAQESGGVVTIGSYRKISKEAFIEGFCKVPRNSEVGAAEIRSMGWKQALEERGGSERQRSRTDPCPRPVRQQN